MTLSTAYAATHGATVLSGLTGLDTQMNPEVDNNVNIGSPYPQFAILRGQKPTIQFQTNAISATLATTGSVGADIDTANPFVATYAKMNNGTPVAADEHRTYTANRGLLIPRRLTAAHQQSAQLDVEALIYAEDPAVAPLVIADNAALPVIARDDVHHTLAKASVTAADGTTAVNFGCTTNLTVEFNNNAQTRGCNSNIWDSHVEQPGVQPVITLTGLDYDFFSDTNIPFEGTGQVRATCVIFLRRYSLGGVGFFPDADTEHVRLDIEGMATVLNHTGQGTSTAELSLQITGTLDASGNAPIGITTGVAIT